MSDWITSITWGVFSHTTVMLAIAVLDDVFQLTFLFLVLVLALSWSLGASSPPPGGEMRGSRKKVGQRGEEMVAVGRDSQPAHTLCVSPA